MKSLSQHIEEKLTFNKDYRGIKIVPESVVELGKIIRDRYDKLGPGTKQNPIDFNDIDVSNIEYFCNKANTGIFDRTKFEYIDISGWNVSRAKSFRSMFEYCKELVFVGDISNWDVSKVTDMSFMFYGCEKFDQDLSNWNVSKVTNMGYMFYDCKSFNQDLSNWKVSKVKNMAYAFAGCESFDQDISSWDVSGVTNMSGMFYDCKSFNQDLSNWNVSNVVDRSYMSNARRNMSSVFHNCPIKDEYKPKFK